MPEGRASTGSESRRWIDYRCAHGHRFAISVESLDGHTAKCAVCGTITVEVVERDHDERAETFKWPAWWEDGELGTGEQLRELVHALHGRAVRAEMRAKDERERTVKAVVEALQEEDPEDRHGYVQFVAERFNLTEGRDDG